jgi:acetoin utilization deacetylase AcuC-like enzyme
MKVVYSEHYDIDIKVLPWQRSRYALVLDRLKAEGLIGDSDVMESPMADDRDILRVHTVKYWQKLYNLEFAEEEIERMEIPVSRSIVDLFWRACGGTILASEQALKDGCCVHLGGGFHHAFPDHGSGFCLINDIAVSVRALLDKGMIGNAAIIDCDLHQGDGTAWIFRDDPRVFTLSLHQTSAFPHYKQRSTLDVDLEDGTTDGEYLSALATALKTVFDRSRSYDLVHYQAGADPYVGDTLGSLRLSIDGLLARDRAVLDAAIAVRAPVVITLGGGYASNLDDVIQIHCNTVRAALDSTTARLRLRNSFGTIRN